ncbi:Uncharacterised protein [Mycobacteroides abscessus subsp. abscessus]|nr:Uncharacterised protein [Mycobacteroides abscessus subsp. abscessus]
MLRSRHGTATDRASVDTRRDIQPARGAGSHRRPHTRRHPAQRTGPRRSPRSVARRGPRSARTPGTFGADSDPPGRIDGDPRLPQRRRLRRAAAATGVWRGCGPSHPGQRHRGAGHHRPSGCATGRTTSTSNPRCRRSAPRDDQRVGSGRRSTATDVASARILGAGHRYRRLNRISTRVQHHAGLVCAGIGCPGERDGGRGRRHRPLSRTRRRYRTGGP